MNKRLNNQSTKEKSVVKIEANEINDSASSSRARRIDQNYVVKVDHCLNSSSSTDNIKNSGGTVIIDYLCLVLVIVIY